MRPRALQYTDPNQPYFPQVYFTELSWKTFQTIKKLKVIDQQKFN